MKRVMSVPDLTMDLSKIEDWQYESTAERHYVNCLDLVRSPTRFRELIYAALELRMCVERLCFEYLLLLTHKKRELSKRETKLYKPNDLIKKVAEEEPYFDKMAKFADVVLQQQGIVKRVMAPDGKWLIELHGKLGDFLHHRTNIPTNEDMARLIATLEEALPRLKKYITSCGAISNFAPHAQAIFDDYVAGKIDRGQMAKRIEIATLPPYLYNGLI